MKFYTSEDYGLVRQIVTDPKLYPWLSDDFSPAVEDYRPVVSPAVHYTLAYTDDSVLLGLFMFVEHSPVLWEVHTCLLPSAWGDLAAWTARACQSWLWSNSTCMRLITQVPTYNRLALRFAREAGLVEYGRNIGCYQKHGKLYDVALLGLSRPEET